MFPDRVDRVIVAVALSGCLSLFSGIAQTATTTKANPGSLDSVLATLQANVGDYTRTVPSFFCSEYMVSKMEPAPTPTGSLQTVSEAVFRVRREVVAEGRSLLRESRQITSLDNSPPPQNLAAETTQPYGPIAVFGIYMNSLNLVTARGKSCFSYRLRDARKGYSGSTPSIDFDELPSGRRPSSCPSNGRLSGHAFLQPSASRVTRIEATVLDYSRPDGKRETWKWSIDYAPVKLDGKTFWMPAAIHSTAIPQLSFGSAPAARESTGGPASTPVAYSLTAAYSNYHLLQVNSRLLPTPGGNPDPPIAPPPD